VPANTGFFYLSDALFHTTVFSFLNHSMLGFNIALSKIEVGIAYAVWSALGTLVVTYIGIACFGESFDLHKLLCLALIVVGVIGLNIREDHTQ
jgi:small multidrug resistance pump